MKPITYIVLLFIGVASAAEVFQLDPYHGGTHTVLDFTLTNNDPGAIYDSGFISEDILGYLASQLLYLPVNSEKYDTIEELMGDWDVLISSDGNVYNGWHNTLNPDGSVDLWNIGGIPGLSYDLWTSAAGSNMMALTLRIPLSQLSLGGSSGYCPDRDVSIVLTDISIPAAFEGHEGGTFGRYFYSPMHQYGISFPYDSCFRFDLTGDLFIDLTDFAHFSQRWLIDYGIEDLHLFLGHWLNECE